MMKQAFALLVFTIYIFSACMPVWTPTPTATTMPTAMPTPISTVTATPLPTATPIPTPNPEYQEEIEKLIRDIESLSPDQIEKALDITAFRFSSRSRGIPTLGQIIAIINHTANKYGPPLPDGSNITPITCEEEQACDFSFNAIVLGGRIVPDEVTGAPLALVDLLIFDSYGKIVAFTGYIGNLSYNWQGHQLNTQPIVVNIVPPVSLLNGKKMLVGFIGETDKVRPAEEIIPILNANREKVMLVRSLSLTPKDQDYMKDGFLGMIESDIFVQMANRSWEINQALLEGHPETAGLEFLYFSVLSRDKLAKLPWISGFTFSEEIPTFLTAAQGN